MLHEHRIATQEAQLHCVAGPDHGPPLLLLHGVTRRWQDFAPLLPELLPRWQVFALDFRGHGNSQRTPGKYLTIDYVSDAVAMLSEVIDGPAIFYGHSLGAMVAAATAARVPEKVRALVLEDPPFETMGERIGESPLLSYFRGMHELMGKCSSAGEFAAGLAGLRFGPSGDETQFRLGDLRDAASLRFSGSCLARLDADVFAPIVERRWLEGYEVEAVCRAIRCPTLLLQADVTVGGMLTDDDAALAAGAMDDCTHIKLEGCNHLMHWSERPAVVRLLHAFLESLD